MKLQFEKAESAFEKSNSDYFVLLNANRNALFLFEKDVKVIWDLLDHYLSFEALLNALVNAGYMVDENDLLSILEFLSKTGLLLSDEYQEDVNFIAENNHLDDYINICSSSKVPTILHMELTNKCNLKCIHCFHDDVYCSLDLADVNSLFSSLKNSPFVRVTLTGGEVCLHPFWRDIVRLARENGLVISFFSNITLLTPEDITYLKQMNVSLVRTSIYGASSDVHDAITLVKGSFEKTKENLIALKNVGVPVGVACVVMKGQVEEVLQLKKIMEEIGVDISFDFQIIPSIQDTKDIEKLMITKEEFVILMNHGLFKRPTKIKCEPGTYRIAVGYNGEFYSCDSLRVAIGNIKSDNLLDALKGKKMHALLNAILAYNPEDCKTCRYDQYCTRCPGLSWSNESMANVHHKSQCLHMKISCS